MTPYEWIGYCVAWAVAIACTAIPVFVLNWAMSKLWNAAGIFALHCAVMDHSLAQSMPHAIAIHGWHWWKWKRVTERDLEVPRPPIPDDAQEAAE